MKHTVQCMTCPKRTTVEAPDNADQSTLFYMVARWQDWAMSEGLAGRLICCPECYPTVFNTSVGSVGTVRPEYDHLRIKDETDEEANE